MKTILFLCLLTNMFICAQDMNNSQLNTIIQTSADEVNGGDGQWQFKINDRVLICISDSTHNRMRILTPITEVEQLDNEQLTNALTANFHTALDVKYAISDDILWSVFIHPLKELRKEQVKDAIMQVYSAAETFGSSYSSTDLVFPGSSQSDETEKEPETKPLKQG